MDAHQHSLTVTVEDGHPDVTGLVRLGALAGLAGPVLFTAAFLAQQWARRDSYDWVAEPVSNLEAGPHGWVQQLNFVVFAVLMATFALALHRALGTGGRRWWAPALLGLSSVGLLLAAALPIEEDASGTAYDPGGHFVAGVTFFLSSALAQVALGATLRHDPRWAGVARYALACGVVALAGFVVLGRFAVPDGAPLHEWAGLLQRTVIMVVTFPCLVTVAWRLRRLTRGGA
jgi:hypothetical membrane protein